MNDANKQDLNNITQFALELRRASDALSYGIEDSDDEKIKYALQSLMLIMQSHMSEIMKFMGFNLSDEDLIEINGKAIHDFKKEYHK